jgi:hypothetical protein
MSRADWWYSYSDDHKVRERGSAEISQINKDLHTLASTNPEAARTLWTQHAPKEFTAPNWNRVHQIANEQKEPQKDPIAEALQRRAQQKLRSRHQDRGRDRDR